MKTYTYNQLSDSEIESLCRRPKMDFGSVFGQVQPILDDIESNGDQAIREFTQKFDGVDPDPLVVDPNDILINLSDEIISALDRAMHNISKFHQRQISDDIEVETQTGVDCRRVSKPIEKVGVYVPGGTAPLPSTAMMLCIPAMIAGCKTIVLATPPGKDGAIPESVAYVAQKTGVSKIVKAGGAQAIAGMALGTESIPKVDKIFGPGNQYVTAAKMMLQNSEAMISIDMPAGPSEVLVIADETADPEFVAIDLLSQAEHGADSQAILVATKETDIPAISEALEKQLANLPRKEFASKAIENSFIVVVDHSRKAIQFSNRYAPEHLIINTKDADYLADKVTNAGSVFIGPWTPESMGDYASGTNHTLPTYGYARMYSGVSLSSFQKFITMQKISEKGLKDLGPTVETLAKLEGLDAHKQAVSLRLKKLSEK
ncbi:histidinol dehydrogenase [Rhodohalobacter sulfatireducens]|uniref:Histidinol dehydrogenase n=1 Tax=Rhodohalobacter sulfatireducens TaxID=2911366 RepID=A0ABS9K9B7_9BACT|nr:histidinol dehydrogenase [Rhodohalobacter sulfatireducens]MCG2587407.1 histidinol dehydrogenase [Rhodohalobacter sulfatireducens]